MMIVSACLAGVRCRYDGQAVPNSKVLEWVANGQAIPICPEILGGLPTPRPCVEWVNGQIVSANGTDFTAQYLLGASKALSIAILANCSIAILKSKSPTCGCGKIYDGTFSSTLINSDGLFVRLLKQQGVTVYTEKELDSFPS